MAAFVGNSTRESATGRFDDDPFFRKSFGRGMYEVGVGGSRSRMLRISDVLALWFRKVIEMCVLFMLCTAISVLCLSMLPTAVSEDGGENLFCSYSSVKIEVRMLGICFPVAILMSWMLGICFSVAILMLCSPVLSIVLQPLLSLCFFNAIMLSIALQELPVICFSTAIEMLSIAMSKAVRALCFLILPVAMALARCFPIAIITVSDSYSLVILASSLMVVSDCKIGADIVAKLNNKSGHGRKTSDDSGGDIGLWPVDQKYKKHSGVSPKETWITPRADVSPHVRGSVLASKDGEESSHDGGSQFRALQVDQGDHDSPRSIQLASPALNNTSPASNNTSSFALGQSDERRPPDRIPSNIETGAETVHENPVLDLFRLAKIFFLVSAEEGLTCLTVRYSSRDPLAETARILLFSAEICCVIGLLSCSCAYVLQSSGSRRAKLAARLMTATGGVAALCAFLLMMSSLLPRF
ncbi:hypothetical protein OWV82_006965 [Melia azedarach]|uniref:Uncharacterized protein n=1 Tax=Melia azedarach TaxID=155640 RepID=A0ACC1YKF1_MELAZ|nr:hypothetical protein OWV82_006965 [Melia azedarach]